MRASTEPATLPWVPSTRRNLCPSSSVRLRRRNARTMTIDTTFYRDLAYVFGAAVAGGALAKALRQPLILGYVLGGVLIGPFTPGPSVSGIKEFELLAEMGVILLMYSIGLEFSFRDLLEVKWVAILGGAFFSPWVSRCWWVGCWAGVRSRVLLSVRLFPSLARWCFPDYWRIGENCARLMAA